MPAAGSGSFRINHSVDATVPDIDAFVHGLTPHQTLAIGKCESWNEADKIIKRSQIPCSHFFTGRCKFSDRCSFSHTAGRSQVVSAFLSDEGCAGVCIGDRVEIHGLANSQDLNGRQGTVESFMASSQRFGDMLDGEHGCKAIRPENLRKIG